MGWRLNETISYSFFVFGVEKGRVPSFENDDM